ncbi:MAG: hypothetical protein EPN97_09630 [Alphaproteobacteria bacterium]|nr:MAG: hypothetical protein EPN97_09630 [Alphaproteobacteria bacterium]
MEKYFVIAAAILIAICLVDLSIGGEGIIGVLKGEKNPAAAAPPPQAPDMQQALDKNTGPLQRTGHALEQTPYPNADPLQSPDRQPEKAVSPPEPEDLQRALKPLSPPAPASPASDMDLTASMDRMIKAQGEHAKNVAAAQAVAASLPAVKRIFTCDTRPAPEAIVEGISRIQKFIPAAADCSRACDFQPVETYYLYEPERCSLRNSLTITPNEIKATYPPGLLRAYVDHLHELRRQNPDWKTFTAVSEDLRNLLKEYMWVHRCETTEIGIVDTVFKDKVNACDEPYYVMVRGARNLDGAAYPGGHKYDSYYWQLLDLEEMKDGNFLVADYADLRYMPPVANLYILDRDDLSFTPVIADEMDPFTGDIRQTKDIHAAFSFNRDTLEFGAGGMNVHVGTSWSAAYHLNGTRLILDELRAGGGYAEPKVIYRRGGKVDRSALIDPRSNIKSREDRRRDPKVAEEYKERLPPLNDEQRKNYLMLIAGTDAERDTAVKWLIGDSIDSQTRARNRIPRQ